MCIRDSHSGDFEIKRVYDYHKKVKLLAETEMLKMSFLIERTSMYHGKDAFSSSGVKGILSAHSENLVNY